MAKNGIPGLPLKVICIQLKLKNGYHFRRMKPPAFLLAGQTQGVIPAQAEIQSSRLLSRYNVAGTKQPELRLPRE